MNAACMARRSLRALFLIIAACVSTQTQAQSIISSGTLNANHSAAGHEVGNLSDGNVDTYFYTGDSKNWGDNPAYIEFEVNDGMLSENDADNCIVACIRRHNSTATSLASAHPRAFRVDGQFEDNSGNKTAFIPLFYTYILFRGNATQEFSEKIPVSYLWKNVLNATDVRNADPDLTRAGKKLTKLRFYVTLNNNNRRFESGAIELHDMAMSGFDVIKVARGEQYFSPFDGNLQFTDRFHLTSDYLNDLNDIKFENTRGIVDPINIPSNWAEVTQADLDQVKKETGVDLSMPSYDFITGPTKDNPYPLDQGQRRQASHTVEHILYALPGDVVTLYPYYQLYSAEKGKYQFNYAHWYDYKTGGRMKINPSWSVHSYDLLDFMTDPAKIQFTDNYGFFGSQHLNIDETNVVRREISTAQEWIDLTVELNGDANKNRNYYIYLTSDLDFKDVEDPVEPLCNSYYWPFNYYLNGNGHTIKNLKIDRGENVGDKIGVSTGLIGYSGSGGIIENLIIDSSCSIRGAYNVGGLIGEHQGGSLTIRNVRTEATVVGKRTNNEQTAAGLIGFCNKQQSNPLSVVNCYVGGTVGDETLKHATSRNAALIAWWETNNNPAPAIFRNVVVNCNLIGYEKVGSNNHGPYKRYIRQRQNLAPIEQVDGGVRKGNFEFYNCYGNIDRSDECWTPSEEVSVEYMPILAAAGWKDSRTPAMSEATDADLADYPAERRYSASNVEEYINQVNVINSLPDTKNVYFSLESDIDFSGRTDVPMLGTSAHPFAGFLDGKGHTVSNLSIVRTGDNVGIVGEATDGIRIENLIIDESCSIVGNENIGIIGYHQGGRLTVCNLITKAKVMGTRKDEQAAAGILGKLDNKNTNNVMTLENVYIGGSVGNPDESVSRNNGAIAGWFENRTATIEYTQSVLKNVVVDCRLYNPENADRKKYIRHHNDKVVLPTIKVEDGSNHTYEQSNFRYENCFGSRDIDETDLCWGALATIVDVAETGEWGWKDNVTPGEAEERSIDMLRNDVGDHKPGLVATFLYPRNPYSELGDQLKIFEDGATDDEYVIAADFSQRFDISTHLDKERGILYEPPVSIRHIFRIRDGKAIADELSGSEESNRKYLRRNKKVVSARAGVPFQIRLTTPVPKENTNGRSNIYYKLSDNNYARVCEMEIRVLDAETREDITAKAPFKFSEEFDGLGSHKIGGVEYVVGEGGMKYYRMLGWDKPEEGSYIVQMIGKDDAGQPITILNTEKELVVMEYHISFLPAQAASMLTEEDLYDDSKPFKHARIEYLDENYGGPDKQPTTFIDFDEYAKLRNLSDQALRNKFISTNGQGHSYFKWPVAWKNSDYSFGYNARQDYNMYMLADFCDGIVPYCDAAKLWKGNWDGDGDGLYDRLYYRTLREHKADQTVQKENGYFYYVNAATDPGVTARLKIEDLCQGSTIHVSAWMSEFSKTSETANLSFNFVAVLKDDIETKYPNSGLINGDRIVVHQFITGYVPSDSNNGATSATAVNEDKRGEWLNIYYSFVPRLSDFTDNRLNSDMVDHYEIELDNNAKSSQGADYAIDDIRAYVVSPAIEASQLDPLCMDSDVRIKVEAPFETLLELTGQSEAINTEGVVMPVYYAFIDKQKFDEQLAGEDNKGYDYIFNDCVVAQGEANYATTSFNSRYNANPDYVNAYSQGTESAYRYIDPATQERLIVFESLIKADGPIIPDKEYYLALSLHNAKDSFDENELASMFDLNSTCAAKCVMMIIPSQVIKVEGEIQPDRNNIVICENTSPIIQANVVALDEDGKRTEMKNEVFDWFYGSIEEFTAYCDDADKEHTLQDALLTFRALYPDADSTDGISAGATDGKETLEQWMLDIIDRACTVEEGKAMPRLTLHRRSFIIPPLSMGDEDMNRTSVSAVAIPIAEKHTDHLLICTDPTEVTVTLGNKSPKMRHGFKNITYPEDMADVPLRIGLEQIWKEDGKSGKSIEVPVRLAYSPDENVGNLRLRNETRTDSDGTSRDVEGCMILVQTDDPAYSNLGEIKEDDKDENGIGYFPWIGEVTTLKAGIKNSDGNLFRMKFDDSFDIKEGYYYKLRFDYQEDPRKTEEDLKEGEVICDGQDLITLKIVPKYQVWTGAEGLNWNNDANWSRLPQDEIFSKKKDGEHKNFVTDGRNANRKSYTPLDFTHVVVKNDVEAPYLYAMDEAGLKVDYDKTYEWSESTSAKTNASADYSDFPQDKSRLDATDMMQYDMAAKVKADEGSEADVLCRPWYANTCYQIHFKPGATIMNQQELSYEKAWVDVELDHSRWYTLANPLKEVYAGDFYLPSAGGRQESELFQDIAFDNELKVNDRFSPAVFQRGWDKSRANVYELNSDFSAEESPRNVAVKTFWSNVYNDVNEQYGRGVGFSIKTDVSMMSSGRPGDDGKVLFRLPKADTEYLYFTQDGAHSGHKTDISRSEDHYRLNDTEGNINAQTATPGKYFLVGNPFMTHMDIAGFLEKNKDVVQQKYWIVSAAGQIAGTLGENGSYIAAPVPDSDGEAYADPSVIAPMQGFFVEAKTETTSLSLAYDASMMRRYGSDGDRLTQTTRAAGKSRALRITSCSNGVPASAALLIAEDAEGCDVAAMDNRDLDVASTVYTAKAGQALSVNFSSEVEGVEIGLIADADTETVIRINGVDAAQGLYLLDKSDLSLTPLEEDMEIEVRGSAAGRFFLTYGIPGEGALSGIDLGVTGGVLTVTDNASSGLLEVTVYDTMGRVVDKAAGNTQTLSLPLGKGIYVVEMRSARERKTAKIRI